MAAMTIGEVFDDLDARINEHTRKQAAYMQLTVDATDEDIRRGAASMAVVENNIAEELKEIRANFTALGATWL